MVLSRLRRAVRPRPDFTLEPTPDGVPKRGFFSEPVRVVGIDVLDPEHLDDGVHRVAFRIEVKDAEGRRCSDLAVDVRISGPERTRQVQAVTDLFGRVKIRMTGPAGVYAVEVLDVAAKGLRWDPSAGPSGAQTSVAP